MLKLNYLILFIISSAIVSCQLNEDSFESKSSFYRIKSKNYYFPDKTFNEVSYSYDNFGRISKTHTIDSKKDTIFTESFIYNGDFLVRIERGNKNMKEAEQKFTYSNNQVKSSEYWSVDVDGVFKKDHENIYEYQDNILKKVTSTFTNGSPSFYSIYAYKNGNIESVKGYDVASNELLEVDEYEYDNNNNPFFDMSRQYVGSPYASSKNNVIHYKITSYKHIPTNPEMRFEYEYNSNNYPIRKYIKGADGKKFMDESFDYAIYHSN